MPVASFTVTFFTHFSARNKSEDQLSVPALVELIESAHAQYKDQLPWLKLAQFGDVRSPKGSLRWDANVLHVSGAEADYDLEQMPIEAAAELLRQAGIWSILYTSPSHSIERPRFRVLAPFSQPLDKHQRGRMVARINGVLGGILAPESFTISQSYYYGFLANDAGVPISGAHQVIPIDGTPIDCLTGLDQIAIGKTGKRAAHLPSSLGGNGQGAYPAAYDSYTETSEYIRNIVVTGTPLHTSVTSLTGRWARADRGEVAERMGTEMISALMDAYTGPRAAEFRQRKPDELQAVHDIFVKERAKPEHQGSGDHHEELLQFIAGAELQPFVVIAEVDIPPRQWLWGGHYMRGAVSCTVAGGGFGKSSLAVYEALRMAEAGRNVWFITGEEDGTEMQRRFTALGKHDKININTLNGKLYIDDSDSFPLKLAKSGRDGTAFDEAELMRLEQTMRRNAIDAVILDPLVEFHSMAENDNVGVAGLVYRLRSIAKRCNAAIELVHHVRKPPSGVVTTISIDDARGGGALTNACRSGRVLNRMSKEEATLANIDTEKRVSYLKLDNPKRNYAPPEKATWYKLASVTLDNADNVQAAERYEFPAALAEASLYLLDHVLGLLKEKP
jgi:RecA-family ATPase